MNTQMRKQILFIILLSLLMLAFAPFRPQSREVQSALLRQHATDAAIRLEHDVDAESVYDVSIILLNISNIDIHAGSYDLDFYISFFCATPPCASEPNWDIMNSPARIFPTLQSEPIPFEEYHYRVKGKLLGYIDYTFYPFDYLLLDLYIEDKELDSSLIAYQLSSITVDQNLFDPKGWVYTVDPDAWQIQNISYFDDSSTYARLDVFLLLEREWGGAFMKTLFPAIVIVFIALLSFLITHTETKDRFRLTSSTLLGIILYHLSVTSKLPLIGYMTFADMFMIACYIAVFLSLIVAIGLMILVEQERDDAAKKLHLATRWTIPSLWVVAIVLLFIFGLFAPYSRLLN